VDVAKLFSVALGAILIENFVLARFLGLCPFLGASKKVGSVLGMGLPVMFFMVVVSAIAWVVNAYVLAPLGVAYLRTVVFVLLIASLVQLTGVLMKKAAPSLFERFGAYLPLVTTNCAVLGVALLVTDAGHFPTFLDAVFYSLVAAVGFILALFLLSGLCERLQFADCPPSFEGVPIVLVAAALLAMVFMGFSGLGI